MDCEIFIRSHAPDFKWLWWCLAGISRYCTGFSGVTIVVPDRDLGLFKEKFPYAVKEDQSGFPFPIHVHTCPVYKDDYLGQQITKMQVWKYVSAPLVLYVDSDVIFHSPVTPDDFKGEHPHKRPILWVTRYKDLSGAVLEWKPITEKALGFECAWETMRRLPMMHYVDAVKEAYSHIGGERYILDQPIRAFSEFNVIGSYVLHNRDISTRYEIRDTQYWIQSHALPPSPAKQFWSHQDWNDGLYRELRALIKD